MKNYRLFALISVLIIAALVTLPSAAQTNGADCRYWIAGRTFAHQFSGMGNFEFLVQNAGAGYFHFENSGRFTGVTTFAVGRLVLLKDIPSAGTFTAKWNGSTRPAVCTGTITEEGDSGNVFQFVVGESGNAIEIMHADENQLIVGMTAVPMMSRCNKATLNSSYAYSAKGWIVPPQLPFPFPMPTLAGLAPLGFSGVINFDGRGGLKGWDTVSLNGLIQQRTFTGEYTVAPNCVSAMTLVDTLGNIIHTENFILKDGKAIHVVNTDLDKDGLPTTVLSFTATETTQGGAREWDNDRD